MTLSSLCTSLPLSKRLKELMPNYKSLFYWNEPNISHGWDDWHISDSEFGHGSISLPAPTSSELMEILPYQINTKEKAGSGYGMTAKPRIEKNAVVYRCEYVSVNATYANVQSESLADALALLLIHLIENELWKPTNYLP